MRSRLLIALPLIGVCLVLAPSPAAAQDWQDYPYPEHGFAVHFPAPPTVTKGVYKTTTGIAVPSTVYAVKKDNILYSVTVGDFSQTAIDDQAVIDDAVKAAGLAGEIKLDVDARISRRYGHELSVKGKDGSYSMMAIFFFDHRFYNLVGKVMPPDAEAGASKTIRFQQSLQFPGA
jgi:hypothetical protein